MRTHSNSHPPRIQFSSVTFGYKPCSLIFKKVNLTIESSKDSGKVVSVIGPSGSGKTTLLRLIAGLEKEKEGSIEIQGNRISYLPQSVVIFEYLNAKQNACYFLNIAAQKQIVRQEIGNGNFEEYRKKLDIDFDKLSNTPHQGWSGGQKQRLCLLRALSIDPDILLLDEPCNGLDVSVRRDFLRDLRRVAYDRKKLIIYVSHHSDEVLWIADEVLLLRGIQSEQEIETCEFSINLYNLHMIINQPPNLETLLYFLHPLNIFDNCTFDGKNLLKISQSSDAAESWQCSITSKDGELPHNTQRCVIAFCANTLTQIDGRAQLYKLSLTIRAQSQAQDYGIAETHNGTRLFVPMIRQDITVGQKVDFLLRGPAWFFADKNQKGIKVTLSP